MLLLRFDKRNAYFIQIKKHSSKFNLWYQKQLIKIIHQNWPEIIVDKRISIIISNSILNKDKKNGGKAIRCFTCSGFTMANKIFNRIIF